MAEVTKAAPLPAPSGTAERVVGVVDEVARRREIGVRELGLALEMSRSAAHRVLQVLARHRVVRTLPSGRYVVGSRLLSWANSLATRDPLITAADDVLTRAAALTREAAYLCGYREGTDAAVVLGVWPGLQQLRYELVVGSTRPLHGGAAGKAIMSELIAGARSGDAWLPPVDADYLRELQTTRDRGYSKSIGELNPAATGVGCAVVEHGHVIGAVGFTVPRQRILDAALDELGAVASLAAHQITEALSASTAVDDEGAQQASVTPGLVDHVAREGRDVTRVVELLDAIARSGRAGVDADALAPALGSTKATTRGMVDRLLQLSMLRETGTGRYLPGMKMLTWPGLLPAHTLTDIARYLLVDLSATVGETVSLVALDAPAGKVRFLLSESSPQAVKYVVAPGTTAALHAGAAGKVVLAQMDPDAWPRDASLRAYTAQTITSPDDLHKELKAARREGYAVSVGESIAGAVGIAAPYFIDGSVAGAVVITMPAERFQPSQVPTFADPLTSCGSELTQLLSGAR